MTLETSIDAYAEDAMSLEQLMAFAVIRPGPCGAWRESALWSSSDGAPEGKQKAVVGMGAPEAP